jgi:DNA polymerase I-like protein with 3'-5' exonuclease and polymerase domains
MYDVQCYFREWGLSVHATDDTMVKHHTLYSYMQKDLALLASMYVDEYTMWKGELYGDNQTRWKYNIKDVVYTLKVDKILTEVLKQEDKALQEFYLFKQFKVCKALTSLMLRGVPIDLDLKEHLKKEFTLLHTHARELIQWQVNDENFNPDSPDQVKVLFKEVCGMRARDSKGKEIRNETQSESFGAKAMIVYLEEYPEWKPLLHLYLEYKKIGTNIRNFLNAKVSEDMLMRCYYSFVKSDRLNSSKMLTGEGMNLQNIPSGTRNGFTLKECLQGYEQEDNSDMDFLDEEVEVEYTSSIDLKTDFGRVKDLFIPPKDCHIFDLDFSAIDLNWVALEANCKWVLDILRSGDCVYRVLAELYYGYPVTKKMEERQIFKAIVHGTNYLGFPATLAAAAGLSVPEVQRIREFYKGKCPEIWEWHKRLEQEAKTKGFIRNYFGGRYWGVNMNDNSNPTWRNKLVALQPQSSAGILVNKGICELEEHENPSKFVRIPVFDENGNFERLEYSFNPDIKDKKGIKTVMQVHDSGVFLARKDDITAPRRIINYFSIELNYPIPITIPVGLKASAKSYGDCNEELAKELLAKADKYIEEHPNWSNEV